LRRRRRREDLTSALWRALGNNALTSAGARREESTNRRCRQTAWGRGRTARAWECARANCRVPVLSTGLPCVSSTIRDDTTSHACLRIRRDEASGLHAVSAAANGIGAPQSVRRGEHLVEVRRRNAVACGTTEINADRAKRQRDNQNTRRQCGSKTNIDQFHCDYSCCVRINPGRGTTACSPRSPA
jgi:hypothetical protein